MHNRQEDVKMELSKLKKKIEEKVISIDSIPGCQVDNRFNWKYNKGHWEEK